MAQETGMASAVTEFYSAHSDLQWSRFDQFARVEEYVLHRTLDRYLPAAPATVADVGGGMGRHAFYLAERGYQVRLCDPASELVAGARARDLASRGVLASAEVADARALPWPDRSQDAALVLGPMYCLADAADRAQAIAEVSRVLRPGGTAFFQFFQRIAALRSLLEMAPQAAAEFAWDAFLRTGSFQEEHIPEMMRLHYFTTVDEALGELVRGDFSITEYRGMDGPSPGFGQARLARAPEPIARQWGEIAYAVGEAPENVSTSTHLLVVARSHSQ